jgi:hypothetical protein
MIGILGTAFLCGAGCILSKLCTIRATVTPDLSPQYVIITKDQYEALQRSREERIIADQPVLPDYSEKAPLLDNFPQLEPI